MSRANKKTRLCPRGMGRASPWRIAVAGLKQETNDLNPDPTLRRDFETSGTRKGSDVLSDPLSGEIAGFRDAARVWTESPELLPVSESVSWAKGRLTDATWEWAKEGILGPLRDLCGGTSASGGELGVDAVFLALHGAMVAEHEHDCEGALLEEVRAVVGVGVPVVVSYDLHCHVTPRMARFADATVIYHTSPHIDMVETGARAAAALLAILEGAHPSTVFVKVPILVPVERANTQATSVDVAAGKYAAVCPAQRKKLAALEEEPWCLAAGISTTQPWMNVPGIGASIVITVDAAVAGGAEQGARAACALATQIFDAREEFLPTPASASGGGLPSLVYYKDAVEKAKAWADTHAAGEAGSGAGTLVVLGDGVDSTNAGAPGDSTWILQELLRHAWPRAGAMCAMVSPAAVSAARTAMAEKKEEEARGRAGQENGQGPEELELELDLGAVLDTTYAKPVRVRVRVAKLFDAQFSITEGHCAGMRCNLGRAVTLTTQNNVHIVCTETSGALFAPDMFQAAGQSRTRTCHASRDPSVILFFLVAS